MKNEIKIQVINLSQVEIVSCVKFRVFFWTHGTNYDGKTALKKF